MLVLLVPALLIVATFVVACGGRDNAANLQAVTTTSMAVTLADAEADLGYRATKWGARVEIGNLYATVQEPFEDGKLVVAEVTLLYRPSATHYPTNGRYDRLQFVAFDEQGHGYSCTAITSRQALAGGTLADGETVTGFLAYELPDDATVKCIVWHKDTVDWVTSWGWQ